MAQIMSNHITEMRELRGNGLSLKKIAETLSRKHGIEISHQTVSYHLGKVKKSMLEGRKPVRVINVEYLESGPRIFSLKPDIFEKERKNDVVYQFENTIYELRSGCMHKTSLPSQARQEGMWENYDQWHSVFSVGADPTFPKTYSSITNISDSDFERAFNTHTGNEGTRWLQSKNYNTTIFKNQDVSNRLSEILKEIYAEMGHEAVRLSGNVAKDILTLHSIYGSVENMRKQIVGFVKPNASFWNDNFEKVFKQFMAESGIPPGRRNRALNEGCLDNNKLDKFYNGKFRDWVEFEKAILSGFSQSKEWKEAVSLRCQDKEEYDLVKKHGWLSGTDMKQAINGGFQNKESDVWYALKQRKLLNYSYVIDWIRANPKEITRIDGFPSLKALQLHDLILGGFYKSELVVTSKIMEKYNSLQFPGPNFNQIIQMEHLLQTEQFNKFCDVDIEAGSVMLAIKANVNQKSRKKTVNPGIDLEPYAKLNASKSKYAKKVVKRVNERDLDDATVSTWRWLFLHGKGLLEDQRAPRFAELLCQTITDELGLTEEENTGLHHLRRARNDFDKANEEGTAIKPKWSLIENGLQVTEQLIIYLENK